MTRPTPLSEGERGVLRALASFAGAALAPARGSPIFTPERMAALLERGLIAPARTRDGLDGYAITAAGRKAIGAPEAVRP
jgi:hypothetical protein